MIVNFHGVGCCRSPALGGRGGTGTHATAAGSSEQTKFPAPEDVQVHVEDGLAGVCAGGSVMGVWRKGTAPADKITNVKCAG